MELKDFIHRSLVEICQGVRSANKELKVNASDKSVFVLDSARDKNYAPIEFDVAVTTSTETVLEGDNKVKIMVFEAKLGGQAKSANETVSRITFKVIINEDVE